VGDKRVVLGVVIGGLALLLLASVARAAPEFVCPYCGESFNTLEELQSHVSQFHPGERIPIQIKWQ
jgi:hypothetical protein